MKNNFSFRRKIPVATVCLLLGTAVSLSAERLSDNTQNGESYPVQFNVKDQTAPAVIDTEKRYVFVSVPYLNEDGSVYPLSAAPVESFVLSTGAVHTLPPVVDLRKPTFFTITPPDGESVEWYVYGGYQLPDSDFSNWHTERVSGFITIGTTECTEMTGTEGQSVWDNGNPAYSASGSKNWPTKRIKLADGSYAAELTTRSILGIIASGNLFTGRVERDLSLSQLLGFTDKDGKALIDWGVPFEARPKGFRIKFKYDGKGDSCTIMATLENRSTGIRRFIGTAWYTGKTDGDTSSEGLVSLSEPDENGLRTLETAFIYGAPPQNADPLPEGAVQGGAAEDITHVNVVFASSARGDYFKGVKGAHLIVKDFEFFY